MDTCFQLSRTCVKKNDVRGLVLPSPNEAGLCLFVFVWGREGGVGGEGAQYLLSHPEIFARGQERIENRR